jgi:[ribosomal protein S5]-alanine N-acetyltransferase
VPSRHPYPPRSPAMRSVEEERVETDRSYVAGSGRLLLRPLVGEDAGRVESWLNDPRRRGKHLMPLHPANDLRALLQLGRSDQLVHWALDTREERHVGMGRWVHDLSCNGVWEAEVVLSPELKGWDWGPEAVFLLLDHLFRSRNARKAMARTTASHRAALRLLRLSGGRQEGRLRRHVVLGGREQDLLIFGLLREEWEAAGSGPSTESYTTYNPRPRSPAPTAPVPPHRRGPRPHTS